MSRQRPKLTVVSSTDTPEHPPTDNHMEVIREDLVTIRGLVTETRAEAAECELPGAGAVRVDLDDLDHAVGKAINTVDEVTS